MGPESSGGEAALGSDFMLVRAVHVPVRNIKK